MLSSQQFDLDRMKDALALLGVNACLWCKKYFRRSDAGALFDAGGQMVCYGCIREWWAARGAQVSDKERQDLEGKLVFWLRDHHRAESFKDPAKVPPSDEQELCVVANCLECHGTGILGGEERCRYCEGRGTVWVIVPKRKA